MNFSSKRKITALALVLVLGFLPVLGAQYNPDAYELLGGLADVLPESRDLHLPESSLSKASAGTLSGDADSFMSTVDWGSIENFDNVFILGGVDEWGLALGFAKKFGKVYLGASYSGDLIDEVYRRVTNKELKPLWMVENKNDNDRTFGSKLVGENDEVPEGLAVSNNDVNIIVGAGIFGVRLGFSEYIRSVQNYREGRNWGFEESLESSLKPNLELGFNIPVGKAAIKPSLWAAFDVHQYYSVRGSQEESGFDGATPSIYWVVQTDRINFMEPSAGLSIAVELALSDTSSMEFALEGEGALRLYPSAGGSDAISSSLTYGAGTGSSNAGFPKLPLFPNGSNQYLLPNGTNYSGSATTIDLSQVGEVTIPMDLRATGAPSFSFSGDITERLTLGLSAAVNGGFGLQTVEVKSGDVKSSGTMVTIAAAPDMAVGASFHLIPDHFSLHAGFGLELFSFQITTSESESAGVSSEKITETRFGMPTARFGGGLTVNLTQALALDAMIFASGLESFDATKFNLLLTLKK